MPTRVAINGLGRIGRCVLRALYERRETDVEVVAINDLTDRGVSDDRYDPSRHYVLSNGSCTTNCLAPVAKVLLDAFGIERGLMTTIHSYTNDQVPSSTGAARALSEVIPELQGKFDGTAVRVPTVDVSLVDLTVETSKPVSVAAINTSLKQAATSGPLSGFLFYTDEELVSSDFIGHPASWGFSNRMLDVARLVGAGPS